MTGWMGRRGKHGLRSVRLPGLLQGHGRRRKRAHPRRALIDDDLKIIRRPTRTYVPV